ncbi:unnamed protein product [Brachionus calyciflorus]|uniref:G-protein coupled receptors family 2 profile 2 domain-containing protein n=1 Tax=Brachionus calyciflorus TaxID=104777 RepID=A0A813V9G0_9BILA|nr:unnamed protein product [Brachionus calyciflorus]
MIFYFFIFSYLFTLINSECNDYCSRRKSFFKRNCFCTECDIFSDCCQDAQKNISINTTRYTCSSEVSSSSFIYTINQCQSWYTNNETRKKCESPDDSNLITRVPVFSNGIFYKNIYCIRCNIPDIKSKDLKAFNIESRFDYVHKEIDENLINRIISGNETDMDVIITPPEDIPKPRECINSISSCPSNYTNQTIINLCKDSYTAYRYSLDGLRFRNIYCAICNNIDDELCYYMEYKKLYLSSLQLLFDLSDLKNEILLKYDIKLNNESNIPYNKTLLIKTEIDNYSCNKQIVQDKAKKYLTIIGHCISILSLIVLLIFYLRNKVLSRNLPGKILINLSISLLLSQFFFVISAYFTNSYMDGFQIDKCETSLVENKFENFNNLIKNIKTVLPCYLTSVLTHYFYLAFFLWSNIMAYDLFKMFNKSSRITESKYMFLKYSLYSWLLPLGFILIMNIKNYNRFSYGFEKCFISSTIDLLIFFEGPIFLLLLTNLIFMGISIRAIRRVDKMSKKYLKNELSTEQDTSDRKRLILFVKLFVLSGLTWVTGFIGSIWNDKYSIIWYIFIILNSLQGLFIFCSYAFNQSNKANTRSSVHRTLSSMVSKKHSTKETSTVNQSVQ